LDQAQIDEIVSRVIAVVAERMITTAAPRRVLMLFSGAGSGYVAGMQAVRLLSAAGHPLTVALSPSARYVITEARVRQAGAEKVIGEAWVDSPALVGESDLVLIPTLSMNTAAHLALGMMDSLISTLTLGALLAGKPVLAVCDGANPYGNGGKVFGGDGAAAPALRTRMADHLSALMDFGVELVNEGDFLLRLGMRLQPALAAPLPAVSTPARPQSRALPATVVTAAELQGLAYGAAVNLPAGARLTPLAHEKAHSLGLRLVFAGA
jgi:hypothetical protein